MLAEELFRFFMENKNCTVLCAALQAISCPAVIGFSKCREDGRA